MKKAFILLALIVLIILSLIYIIIPGKISISETIPVKAPLLSVSRSLSQMGSWKKWWPGLKPFVYNDQTYSIYNNVLNIYPIDIIDRKDSTNTFIEISSIGSDSTLLNWKAEMSSSINPLERIASYRKAIRIKKNISDLLDHLKSSFENPENIYGLRVNLISVTDSALITIRQSFTHKPDIRDIGDMVQQLKNYILSNQAEEKNYPMLHISKKDSNYFEAMVAIPVDRKLPETKKFVPKFLLKGGKILEAEVRGGPFAIEIAFKGLEYYKTDFRYDSPAIPYQLMVTDRIKVIDTSKWITKLYYPIY